MFGGIGRGRSPGRSPRKQAGRFSDGPVAIPRHERVKLKHTAAESAASISSPLTSLVLPSPQAAAANPSWYGQTYEYAAGVAMKKHILEPIMLQQQASTNSEGTAETARFLSHYAKGQVVMMLNASSGIHLACMERVTKTEVPTLHTWWDTDKTLSYTGNMRDWSEWWVRRCSLFDPGCEMIKLKTMDEKNRTLGVVYFERSVVHDGQRMTLIRGFRIDPSLHPEAARRSSKERSTEHINSFPGVAAALLYHVLFTSIRYGTEGVGVNSPKDDTIEDFYQHFMGMPESISPVDGRRFFRINANDRLSLLRTAFSEQVNFMLAYKDQLLRPGGEAVEGKEEDDVEENEAPTVAAENGGAAVPEAGDVVMSEQQKKQQQEDMTAQGTDEQSREEQNAMKAEKSGVAQKEVSSESEMAETHEDSNGTVEHEAGSVTDVAVNITSDEGVMGKPETETGNEIAVESETRDESSEAVDEQANHVSDKPESDNELAQEETETEATPCDDSVAKGLTKRALESVAKLDDWAKRQKREDALTAEAAENEDENMEDAEE